MLLSLLKCVITGTDSSYSHNMVNTRHFYLGLDLQSVLGPAYPPIVSSDEEKGEEVTGLVDR